MKRIIIILLILINSQFLVSQNSEKYFIRNINVNTIDPNFSATFYTNDFVIYATPKKHIKLSTNRRFRKSERAKIAKKNLDFYFGSFDANGDIKNSKKLSTEINSIYDEVDLTFTNDFKTVYFSRNIIKKRGKQFLKLFKADVITPGLWKNIVELPFNDDDFSVGHPSLSSDNKTLYFVSNMKGTLGSSDIFKVTILGKNSYGKPENLGANVNTNAEETTPFVANDVLYFASNGRGGLGGLDIFSIKLTSNAKAKNIGAPFNSVKNDLAYTKNRDHDYGYFTSNRNSEKGKNEIYFYKNLNEETGSTINEVVSTEKIENIKKDVNILSFYRKNKSNIDINKKTLTKSEDNELNDRKIKLGLATKAKSKKIEETTAANVNIEKKEVAVKFRNLDDDNTAFKPVTDNKIDDWNTLPKSDKVDKNTVPVTSNQATKFRNLDSDNTITSNAKQDLSKVKTTSKTTQATKFRNLDSDNTVAQKAKVKATYTEPITKAIKTKPIVKVKKTTKPKVTKQEEGFRVVSSSNPKISAKINDVTGNTNHAKKFRNLDSNNAVVTETKKVAQPKEKTNHAKNFRNLDSNNAVVTETKKAAQPKEKTNHAKNFRNLDSNNTVVTETKKVVQPKEKTNHAKNFRNLDSNNAVKSNPTPAIVSYPTVTPTATTTESYYANEFNNCQYQLDNINNILFDLNKSYIRFDASEELDRVIEILRYCPSTKIVIASHTDSRGDSKYNLWLSQQRADNSVKYLIEQGEFSADRFTAVGYGEERIMNRCADGVRCSRSEHQMNRRTEIEITNF